MKARGTALAIALGLGLLVTGCGSDNDFPSVVGFIPPQPSVAPSGRDTSRPPGDDQVRKAGRCQDKASGTG